MRPYSCKDFLIWRAGAYRDKNRLGHCRSAAFISFAFRKLFYTAFNWKDTVVYNVARVIWLVSLQLTYSYHTPLASSGHAFHMYSFICVPGQWPPATASLRAYYMRTALCLFHVFALLWQAGISLSLYLWASECLSTLPCHCINPDLDTAAHRSPCRTSTMLFSTLTHTHSLSALDLVALLAASAMF